MQTEQIVALLIAERDRLNRAIEALGGRSAPAKPKAPPATAPVAPAMSAAPAAPAPAPAPAAPAPAVAKRKPRTAAQRKAHSERMRAFWAARRKQQQKGK